MVPPLRWGPNEVLGAKPSDGVPLHKPFKRALLDLLIVVCGTYTTWFIEIIAYYPGYLFIKHLSKAV